MTTVVALVFCLGGILLGGSGIFALLSLGDRWAVRTLRRAQPATTADRPSRRRAVALAGATEYGTAGRQIAPVSGEDCAWYRVRLTRTPRRGWSQDDAPSYDLLLDIASPARPALADRFGRLAVDPELWERHDGQHPPVTEQTTLTSPADLPPVVPGELIADLRRGEKLELTEVRVPRGREVFALARVDDGVLVPNRGGLTVFTPGDRAAAIRSRCGDASFAQRAVLGFGLAGLALAGGSAVALYVMG